MMTDRDLPQNVGLLLPRPYETVNRTDVPRNAYDIVRLC